VVNFIPSTKKSGAGEVGAKTNRIVNQAHNPSINQWIKRAIRLSVRLPADNLSIRPDKLFIRPDKLPQGKAAKTLIRPDNLFIRPEHLLIRPDNLFIRPDHLLVRPDRF
jgi:hypothetical protein